MWLITVYLSEKDFDAITKLKNGESCYVRKKVNGKMIVIDVTLDFCHRIWDLTSDKSKDWEILNLPLPEELFVKIEEMLKRHEAPSRQRIGVTKKVSITLPEQEWNEISAKIAKGEYKSISEYFREKHLEAPVLITQKYIT